MILKILDGRFPVIQVENHLEMTWQFLQSEQETFILNECSHRFHLDVSAAGVFLASYFVHHSNPDMPTK